MSTSFFSVYRGTGPILAALVASLASACGGTAAEDAGSDSGAPDAGELTDGGGSTTGVCETEHPGMTADGEPVTRCDSFFGASPYVRVPADSATVRYGSLDMNDFRFRTRDGVAHPLVSADGTTEWGCTYSPTESCTPISGLEMAHGPSHRWLYTIYRLQGALEGERIRVESIVPVVLVEGTAIDALLARPWEGTISTRIVPRTAGDPASSPIFATATAPFRLEPSGRTTAFDPSTGTETLPDAHALRVELDIANASSGVRLSDGSCAPSLSSLGDANPFVSGTTDTVTIERAPSMHSTGGHHIVIGTFPVGSPDIGSSGDTSPNTMGANLGSEHPLVSPWTWLSSTIDLSAALADTYSLHGNAFVYNLQLTLAPVEGGGGTCP